MLPTPKFDSLKYEIPNDELTLINQMKVYDLENNQLEHLIINKDEYGFIRNIQIKLKVAKELIIYGGIK